MPKFTKKVSDEASPEEAEVTVGSSELADALVQAIEAAKPPAKKTIANRKKNSPWMPKNGEARKRLKRKMYQHGILLGNRLTNEEIELLNKVRPGTYCDGYVKVFRRADKGVDIDYPVKTNSQRLRLINDFGITSFVSLLQRIVAEGESPKAFKPKDEWDDA